MALTVVDAGVIIAVVDASDAHHVAARKALRHALAAGETLVLPASAYAEALVAPFGRNAAAAEALDRFVTHSRPLCSRSPARLLARQPSFGQSTAHACGFPTRWS